MASKSVEKILEAESAADKLTSEARHKAEEIVREAERTAALDVQKKLAEAKSETEKIRNSNGEKFAEYSRKAEQECSKKLEEIRSVADANSEKAVTSIIDSFFG